LKPAIEYAENGFPVFPHLAKVIRSSHRALGADSAWAAIFLPDGKAPEVGDLLVQKDLAATLRDIANGGRESFYTGDIAKSVVGKSDGCGGMFQPARLCRAPLEMARTSFRDIPGLPSIGAAAEFLRAATSTATKGFGRSRSDSIGA
jgi:hypothetical protein